MKASTLLRHLRTLPVWLIPLLAAAATALLWVRETALTSFTEDPQFWLRVVMSGILWLLVLINAATALRMRRVGRELETVLSRRDLEEATLDPGGGAPAPTQRMLRYVPAWLVFVLGLVATGAVWLYGTSLFAWSPDPELWLGIAVSVVLWVLVLANAYNRVMARARAAAVRAARRRENLTLEMLQMLDVMISAVKPDGTRSRFNSCYREFTGRSEKKLEGRGWIECVSSDDREQTLGAIVNHEARAGVHLELEYTMIAADGEPRWVREFLMPRLGADGTLLEYVGSATDITPYVETESEHEEHLEKLRKETEKLRAENAQLAKERRDIADRVGNAERDADAARKGVASAEAKLDKAVIELKAVKSERSELRAEKTKLTKSVEQLTEKLLDAEKAYSRAEEQLASVRKELQTVSGELKSAIKEREAAKAGTERSSTQATMLERTVQNLEASEETLRGELAKARADLKATSKELAQTKAELDRAGGALGKHQQTVESLKTTEKALREEVQRGQAELRTLIEERNAAIAEMKKAADLAEELEKVIESVRASEAALKDQIERDRDQQEKVKGESSNARRTASQHRTKITRLTTRCKELEEQLAAATAQRDQFAGRASAAEQSAAAAARRGEHEKKDAAEAAPRGLDVELSTELRLGLSSVARINEHLRETSLDEMQRNFIENAQASVDAMVSLVEDALGGADPAKKKSDKPSIRAFDLRTAGRGVCELVQPAAEERGVRVRCAVEPNVPGLVKTDPVRLRQVLMYLLNSAIRLVEEGEVVLRIAAEGITSTHGTMRFEITHGSARIGADRIESTFALNRDADEAQPDPARQQAAKAWQIISEMKGNFAFDVPESGGFRIWFTLTLPKLSAGKEALVEDEAPPRPQRPDEPASIPWSASGPAPEAEPRPRDAWDDVALSDHPPAAAPSGGSGGGGGGGDHLPPRLPQEMLESNLGPVLELGAESVRIEMSKVPKGPVQVKLSTDDGGLKLRGELVSHERLGGRKVDAVLRFNDVTEEQRRQIMEIAFAHRRATLLPLETGEENV